MIKVNNVDTFDLKASFFSGQCFRWEENSDDSFTAVVKKNIVTVKKEGTTLYIDGISQLEFDNFYKTYFDLDRNYKKLKEELSSDKVMKEAISFSPNLRILNQEFWETLCSFIISQNNNISRISSIIKNFSKNFGIKLKENYYTFPDANTVAKLSLDDISIIKAGFRGKYIIDAAKKVSENIVNFEKIKNSNLEYAREHLMQIKGVGPKVADCTLLYGAKKFDAFPVDIWIKRAVNTLYPNGIPEIVKKNAGIAQLYIFNYARLNPSIFETN